MYYVIKINRATGKETRITQKPLSRAKALAYRKHLASRGSDHFEWAIRPYNSTETKTLMFYVYDDIGRPMGDHDQQTAEALVAEHDNWTYVQKGTN